MTTVHEDQSAVTRARLLPISWMLLLISFAYVVVTTAWITTENRALLPVMELLTVWSAVVVVLFMVEIHRGAAARHRSRSLAALVMAGAMAAVTISNHFLYLTVLRQLYAGSEIPPWLLLDGWPSVTKALECVAWGLFLGLAMVFAATPARGLGQPVVWTLRVGGTFALAGLVGPATGNMNLYLLSTAGYSVGFLVLTIELVLGARRVPGATQGAVTVSG